MGIAPQEEMAHPPLSLPSMAAAALIPSFSQGGCLPMIRAHLAPGNRATRTRCSGREHGGEGSR